MGNLFEVTTLRSIALLVAVASAALVPASALAQRQPPSPEQRLERLEKQMSQVQRTVFPKGRPADTAGFSDEPAATQSSVATLDQRLDALERQMSDILRQSEENGHRLQTLEGDLGTLRTQQEQRITALEQRVADTAAAAAVAQTPPPVVETPSKPAPKPASKPPAKSKAADAAATPTTTPAAATTADAAADAGEDAYSEGFHLWEAGKYDEAIASLRAFTSAYPKHKRASYANNLIGRSLLDKGDARAAAEALLANYRQNPKGERASDSLYYLGQALMKLGQPGQACKAYAELEDVYGKTIRPDLKKLLPAAKAEAQCS